MSPEVTAAVKAVGGVLAAGFSAVVLHRRRKRKPPADTDARLRAVEVAVARLQVVAERVEPLAETVVELRELAARLQALVEVGHEHADSLNAGFQRLERLALELRGIALAPTIEIVAGG